MFVQTKSHHNRVFISLLSSLLLIALSGSASAKYISTDVQNGGSIGNKGNTSGDFKLSSSAQSRAEFRYKSVRGSSTYVLKGRLKIDKWNKKSERGTDSQRISVIQALNVEDKNSTRGPSNPISQLTIRKTGSGDGLQWYVIYGRGGGSCSSTKAPKEGSTYDIELHMKRGGSPSYYINGTKCQKTPADGDRAGKIGSGNRNPGSGKYFYGKLGAYTTGGSNRSDHNGNGVEIDWRGISDY